MSKHHNLRIKRQYFCQLRSGVKKVEVRVGYPSIKTICVGDTVSFDNYEPNLFDVTRVTVYDSFSKMLDSEGVSSVLPGLGRKEALIAYKKIYPPKKEALGVYAIELSLHSSKKSKRPRIVSASQLCKERRHKEFSKLVHDVYVATDWIGEDYPHHFDLYYSKYIPGVLSGEREIIACYVDGQIAAVAILKKCEGESKLCTLFVKPEFRKQGIATSLLTASFAWLGTTKPLITIADYKLPQFQSIIKKYG